MSNSKKPNNLANLDMSQLQHISGSLNLSNVQPYQHHHQQHQSVSGTSTPRSWFDIDEMGVDVGGELFSDEHFMHIATPTSAIGSPTWSAVTSAASSACNSPRGIPGESLRLFNEDKLMMDFDVENENDEGMEMGRENENGEDEVPKPLNHIWQIYLNDNQQKDNMNYESYFVNDKKIGEFSTVQMFWRYWNTLNAHHEDRPQNFTLKFFKKAHNEIDDFSPVATPIALTPPSDSCYDNNNNSTEYPPLRQGGKWSVYCYDKEKREDLWTELLLAAIGEVDYFGRRTFDVMGIVFQSNQNFDSVYIWSGAQQMSARSAQKMMKRISHIVASEEVGASVGDNTFIEFSQSHFGKSYSYTSSKSNSRSGSGYNSPTKTASRSGYSSPLFRSSKTPQYSPRFNHQMFHTKLKEKLQQRLGAKLDNIVSPPSGTNTSQGSSMNNTASPLSAPPAASEKELRRIFGEKQRRISLNNGEYKIVDVHKKGAPTVSEKEAKNTDLPRVSKKPSNHVDYLIKFFLLFFFAIVLKTVLYNDDPLSSSFNY